MARRRQPRAARLGELERSVMEVLWSEPDVPLTVREVSMRLPSHAYTTVLTVLDRLQSKGMVQRATRGRAFLYRAASTREEFTALVMQDALHSAPDRRAVLARFVESVTPEEAAAIRAALDAADDRDVAPRVRRR